MDQLCRGRPEPAPMLGGVLVYIGEHYVLDLFAGLALASFLYGAGRLCQRYDKALARALMAR
ncbi:MAG: hypothetical protein ACTHN7_05260 [Solirubrobacterales bacterium]